jgi:hypothetical protein
MVWGRKRGGGLLHHDKEEGYDALDKEDAHVDTKVGSKQAFVSCRLAN